MEGVLQTLDELESSCPILKTPFSIFNPPYKTNNCDHHFSLLSLSKLPIYTESQHPGTAYQICPLCREHIHFAEIDYSHLLLLEINSTLKGQDSLQLQKTRTINDLFPKIYEPRGGILGYLNKICENE